MEFICTQFYRFGLISHDHFEWPVYFGDSDLGENNKQNRKCSSGGEMRL